MSFANAKAAYTTFQVQNAATTVSGLKANGDTTGYYGSTAVHGFVRGAGSTTHSA